MSNTNISDNVIDLLEKVAFSLEEARKADKAYRDAGLVKRRGVQVSSHYVYGNTMTEESKRKTSKYTREMARAHNKGNIKAVLKTHKKFNPKHTDYSPQQLSNASTSVATKEVRVAGNVANQYAAMAGVDRKKISGADKELFNRIVTHHEINERRAMKDIKKRHKGLKAVNPTYKGTSHASPSVILREHNQLATLPRTSDTAGTLEVFNKMRHRHGIEGRELGKIIPGYSHGNGQRFSRHAIKRIEEATARRGKMGPVVRDVQVKIDGPRHKFSYRPKTGSQSRRTRGDFTKTVFRKLHKVNKTTGIPHSVLRRSIAGTGAAAILAGAYGIHKARAAYKANHS